MAAFTESEKRTFAEPEVDGAGGRLEANLLPCFACAVNDCDAPWILLCMNGEAAPRNEAGARLLERFGPVSGNNANLGSGALLSLLYYAQAEDVWAYGYEREQMFVSNCGYTLRWSDDLGGVDGTGKEQMRSSERNA